MKQDFNDLFSDVFMYLYTAILSVKPVLVFIGTGIGYVLFPHQAFVTYALSLLVVVLLDIITKYYAISIRNGGLIKAFKDRHISSSKFWEGTRRKIISYLTIMTLTGLSTRFGIMEMITTFSVSLVYFLLFLRESQSVCENLLEAGHEEVRFFLRFLSKKENEISEQLENDSNEVKQEQ